MPYTRKTKLYYPKKGTKEAREWGKMMQSLRKKKQKKRIIYEKEKSIH